MPPHTEGTKPIRHQPSLRSAFHVVFQALRAEFAEKQLRLKFAEVKFVVAMEKHQSHCMRFSPKIQQLMDEKLVNTMDLPIFSTRFPQEF